MQRDQVPDRVAPVRVHGAADHHRQLRGAGRGGAAARRGQDAPGQAAREFSRAHDPPTPPPRRDF